MAKIPRKLLKIFGGSSANNGQFGSAQVGTKVLTNNVDTLQALAAWDEGWLDAAVSSDLLPCYEEDQAVKYVTTTELKYLFQEGVPEYLSTETYYINSIVKAPGTYVLYGSLVDNNIGNSVSDPTKWKYLVNLETVTMTSNSLSVANEIALWDGTGGRDLKRANSFTGYPLLTAGVLSTDTAANTFDNIKQSATTSYNGVAELATTAETQTGTDTGRVITPAGLKGALTFSNIQESSEIAVTIGSASNFAHGLGALPNFIQVFLRCKTAEQNYSVGDEVYWGGFGFAVNNSATGLSIACDTSNIYTVIATGSTGLTLLNKTTGIGFNITVANWRLVVRYG